jgi:hypothetical protein
MRVPFVLWAAILSDAVPGGTTIGFLLLESGDRIEQEAAADYFLTEA